MIKRALISVWFKDGIVELANFLNEKGVEIVSTGGTQKKLEEAGIPVTPISQITGLNSVMDGRVKTLDPKIFGGILADRNNVSHMTDLTSIGGLQIDLIIVNFYPFVQEAVDKKLEFKKAIEYIDIGGPSMIRAAAKNYHSVIPLCDPSLYTDFIKQFNKNDGTIPLEIREKYVQAVFKMTSEYESAIYSFFSNSAMELQENFSVETKKQQDMRYGENPHQKAGFFISKGKSLPWFQHQGKDLSYNNYADLESAINISREFSEPACTIIKHANPCGFGLGTDNLQAYQRAVSTDPVSYFGGIVGFNTIVTEGLAELLVKPFLECIVAPEFSPAALKIFKKKKNLRVIELNSEYEPDCQVIKSVAGGFLIQDRDSDQGEIEELNIVTKLKPTDTQIAALKLGWKLVRYVKSNAIVFANENQLLGVGAGQMSRVDSVKIAIRKSGEAGLNLSGSILASDAFFPFPDSIELAAETGASAIIQPGGSIKDGEVVKKADELNLSMVMTGTRHFYH
ncbi:MAG: bifunctional phosphoribosylaminoimidazolecarboxamide formyltransferase/IMP cyclohydrolase [Candidatus Marinimicrobia bacterium]|jgi:phosphoribosylaminoimidazolecarboxamide formyltransferase/IMP cyclohydrolase|nr:bifunctional phosphoribosylaminoimidazolecarboxamide formyltransferase/IMP cyclohydrolase [Candidatus Neomarinimicrobiota bacterium]MBT3633626.1 bifunctional phosphoribosylaminoimidazolecarboxamide formyltransferase/IMP cyclohydrolase [Candidatus Neomarinimicrobiota bacterium]MBT3682421.1 bifunctional phosphoribosylaminoimidazolecarboxamide formyltransferase/IMP cyclohydrolase [Candidatus Neomarinimicrobiota bacterium]MBT3759185.1 bifunctional phosphoribosylaminoimidazolecarboxamide formyltra